MASNQSNKIDATLASKKHNGMDKATKRGEPAPTAAAVANGAVEFASAADKILQKLEAHEEMMRVKGEQQENLLQELKVAADARKTDFDTMAEKIEQLRETANAQATALNAVSSLHDRVVGLVAQMDELKSTSNALRTLTTDVQAAVRAQDERVRCVNATLTRVDAQTKHTNAFLRDGDVVTQADVEKLDRSNEIMKRKQNGLFKKLNIYQTGVDEVMQSVQQQSTKVDGRLNDLSVACDGIAAKVDRLQSTLAEQQEHLDDMSDWSRRIATETHATLQQHVAANESHVDELRTRHVTVLERLTEVVEQLEEMDARSAAAPPSAVASIAVPGAGLFRYAGYTVVGDTLASAVFGRSRLFERLATGADGAAVVSADQLGAPANVAVLLGFDEHAKANFDVDAFVAAYKRLIDWLRSRVPMDGRIVVAKIPPSETDTTDDVYWRTVERANAALHELCAIKRLVCVPFDRAVMNVPADISPSEACVYFDAGGARRFGVRSYLYQRTGRRQMITTKGFDAMKEMFDAELGIVDESSSGREPFIGPKGVEDRSAGQSGRSSTSARVGKPNTSAAGDRPR